MNLSVPKLHDDGSHWAEYSLRILKAMGSKGLWRHVEGTMVAPKPYTFVISQKFLIECYKYFFNYMIIVTYWLMVNTHILFTARVYFLTEHRLTELH